MPAYNQVSIHAPAWGATPVVLVLSLVRRGFNPRTRMGCDRKIIEYLGEKEVSIHAPAWGATDVHQAIASLRGFQSTHPHGVRRGFCLAHSKCCQFQSTHPHGVRLCRFIHQTYLVMVSIHAPAWGATVNIGDDTDGGGFNPRTRMGCDQVDKLG